MSEIAISETEIVNGALARIGQKSIQDIHNLADPQTAAAGRLYYRLRNSLLRRCRWNFARTFIQLAQLQTGPLGLRLSPDPDYQGDTVYTGAYQLPNDYLRLSSVSPYTSHWRIVGQALYTDAPSAPTNAALIGLQPPNADGSDNTPANGGSSSSMPGPGIEYIRKVSDATKFDPIFVQCLETAIAYNLAFGSTAMIELRQALKAEFDEIFGEARAIDGMEQWPEQLFDNVMVEVRHEYTGLGGGLY